MEVLFFSKAFRNSDVADLIEKGHSIGADGYDLAVRPGYVVSPDRLDALPQAASDLRKGGLSVPMVTAPTDLVDPEDPRSKEFLVALDRADVRLLKMGYFRWERQRGYWDQVDDIRRAFEKWERMARTYNVTVCYHTHSGDHMGLNAAALAHLIRGFDPRYIAGYLDPGHLLTCGETFEFAAAIAGTQLRMVAAKDYSLAEGRFCRAGEGDVDWEEVFSTLKKIDYTGPLSVHAEYPMSSEEAFLETLSSEIAYFKGMRNRG